MESTAELIRVKMRSKTSSQLDELTCFSMWGNMLDITDDQAWEQIDNQLQGQIANQLRDEISPLRITEE